MTKFYFDIAKLKSGFAIRRSVFIFPALGSANPESEFIKQDNEIVNTKKGFTSSSFGNVNPKSRIVIPESKFINLKLKKAQLQLRVKFFVLSLFVFAAGCAQIQSNRNDFVIADSKSYEASLFRQNCAVCHGAEANGKESNGTIIPSLRYGEAANLSEQQIYTQIHDGKLPMPAFKNQLTDDEIKRIVKFVRRDLQGKE